MSPVSSRPFDALIVGGGLHGCMVALTLARAGMKTTLLERGALCREASGVNAGTLTMQMTRVALIPYAMKGHEMWVTARDWLGDVGTVVCDGLSLAFTESEAELLTLRAARRREAGAPIGIIPTARAVEIEPGLSDHPVLAAHCPIDGFTSAYLTGRAFLAALRDAGVAVFEDTPVTDVEPAGTGYTARATGVDGGRLTLHGTRLALCGGVWLEPMAGWLGVRLPIRTLVKTCKVGRDCVGALQFLPEPQEPGVAGMLEGRGVDEGEIARRIRNLARAPLGVDEDESFRISIAGVQEKTALLPIGRRCKARPAQAGQGSRNGRQDVTAGLRCLPDFVESPAEISPNHPLKILRNTRYTLPSRYGRATVAVSTYLTT